MKEKKFNLLETVPCRSAHVRTSLEGEKVVLSFQRFRYKWCERLLPESFSKENRIYLEEHGTAVWNLIDGQRTVGEIIKRLADHFAGEEGYESRVAIYFFRLQKDGFIRLLARS